MTERTETVRTETVIDDDHAVVENEANRQMVVNDDEIVLQNDTTRRSVERTNEPRVEVETETVTRTVDG